VTALLEIEALTAHYGKVKALHGVDLRLADGAVTARVEAAE